ncbi:hypothetical protein NUU61_005015 [Penicillium alfredii]|uniref:V-SNARE n=1 Tax=Penicillium alfredii TaxID=1506179 RepID=A0A9W9F8Y6_9EURO|nr:uncharacterized protein NUU61_005015 [Penicillium alfredii]KAJ5095659.1 hypothetical protein NUU61_005015 [Penicillium alfredii]
MAEKRPSSMPGSAAKRPRISYDDSDDQSEVTSYERPRNDPLYGQKSAFPGLDDASDELFYGPAEDGLEYLRMVRSEANALPSLFAAPVPTKEIATPTTDPQVEPSAAGPRRKPLTTGFFADEAYIAPTDKTSDSATAHARDATKQLYPDAQSSYYNLLHHRFLLLRSTLRCSPPASAIAALDDAHPISLPRNHAGARKEWRHLLLTEDPQMVQLACMDLDSVLGVLKILARTISDNVRSGSAARVRRTGAWAWGLLGKCRDVGELATEEVGDIRDLGKRALTISQKMREAESTRAAEMEAELSDSDPGESTQAAGVGQAEGDIESVEPLQPEEPGSEMPDAALNQPAELEAAKARLQAQLQDSADPDVADPGDGHEDEDESEDTAQQSRAMLDMIVTVAGEFYGQRDLLDAREAWL